MFNIIPDEWRTILHAVQAVAPGAIIAGGALRDHAHGLKPKDIDIFVPDGSDVEAIAAAIRPYRPSRRNLGTLTYINGEISTVIEFHKFEPYGDELFETQRDLLPPVNLIVANWAILDTVWLRRMDFGINQISYDGRTQFATAAFWRDFGAQTFTYVATDRAPSDVARSKRRAERFKEKYPDWTFVLPEVATE